MSDVVSELIAQTTRAILEATEYQTLNPDNKITPHYIHRVKGYQMYLVGVDCELKKVD